MWELGSIPSVDWNGSFSRLEYIFWTFALMNSFQITLCKFPEFLPLCSSLISGSLSHAVAGLISLNHVFLLNSQNLPSSALIATLALYLLNALKTIELTSFSFCLSRITVLHYLLLNV